MATNQDAGKGDKVRRYDKEKWDKGWNKINWSKKKDKDKKDQ